MPERATKEKNLTSYTTFGGVAIQNRIAASFFCVSNEINHLLCGWWEKSLDISKNSCAMMNVGLQNHK